MTFAEAVKRVRTSRKLTQAELATKAHLTRTTLVRLERGLKPGSLARQRVVAAFGFTNLNQLYAAAGDDDARLRSQWLGAEKPMVETRVAPREAARSRSRWLLA